MRPFQTRRLPAAPVDIAPDGTDVRPLLQLDGGGMAHFELGPDQTSFAVVHRTVEEIWYILSGRGEMWRKAGEQEEVVPLGRGVCLTIPLGTRFQFRSLGGEPLAFLVTTVPPWPGQEEGERVAGCWEPNVSS